MPAFNYIASVATNGAGPDGDYSTPSDLATLRTWLDGIRSVGGIMVLDIQPGRSDFVSELRRYESLLVEPDVHVALDPEWRMGPDEVPGTIIGSVGVDELNAATQYLGRSGPGAPTSAEGRRLAPVHPVHDPRTGATHGPAPSSAW